MKSKNGTYLYLIEYYDNVAKSNRRQTYTLIVKNPKKAVKIGINITEPFDVWYQKNKATLKWYSPPDPNTSFLHFGEALNNDLQALDSLDYSAIAAANSMQPEKASSQIASWSRSEVKQAYIEAKQRVEKKTIPIKVSATFSETGLLTLKFNNPVSFPSYLVKEAISPDGRKMAQS